MCEFYADIIVDISHEKLDKPFQYRIPDRLCDKLETGMCVTVPFGNGNRLIKGYVIGIGDTCKFDPNRIKEIQAVRCRCGRQNDCPGGMDQKKLWFYHDTGIENRSSCEKDSEKTGTQNHQAYHEQRGNAVTAG